MSAGIHRPIISQGVKVWRKDTGPVADNRKVSAMTASRYGRELVMRSVAVGSAAGKAAISDSRSRRWACGWSVKYLRAHEMDDAVVSWPVMSSSSNSLRSASSLTASEASPAFSLRSLRNTSSSAQGIPGAFSLTRALDTAIH